MIVNPDIFKPNNIQNSNQTIKPKKVFIGNNVVEIASLVWLLGVHIDGQLNFKLHISNICKSASKKLMLFN